MTVRFENVSYRYPGGNSGVFDIDLEVCKGELLAVIGPSGSGKSTLLKLLAGFLEPAAGSIRIQGRDVGGLPPNARHLGVVFQSYALFPHMRVWENVAYPLKVRGMGVPDRRDRALAALDRVGLTGFADRQPGTLSGGQQQRVALARALVFSPRALLLDEPLSALDAALRLEMRDEIRRVQRDAGIATLHVTHDQEEALSIADRVAVLDAGRLIQVAPPADLYDQPANSFVAAFVGQANLWPARLAGDGRVETAIGRLVTADIGRFRAGERLTVMVRPECVVPLADGEKEAQNAFSGRLGTDRFLGSIRRFDFTVEGGVIRCETAFRGAVHRVAIPPEAIRLLPDDDPTSTRGASR